LLSSRPYFHVRRTNTGAVVSPSEAHPNAVRIDHDILTQPVTLTHDQLLAGVVIAVGRTNTRAILILNKQRTRPTTTIEKDLVGTSDHVYALRAELGALAGRKPRALLLLGETGAGKSHIAEILARSIRPASAPYCAVDGSTLTPETAPARLFGHTKGAFTDARQSADGFFQASSGGTFFLDEIGNLPPEVQAQLLVALDSGQITPVGATVSQQVDVTLIVATNEVLPQLVLQRKFSGPLFERLNRLPITLMPLRQRRVDIGPMLYAFLQRHVAAYAGAERLLSPGDGLPWLARSAELYRLFVCDWSGNVRALDATAERLALQASKDILDIQSVLPLNDRVPTRDRDTAPDADTSTLPVPEAVSLPSDPNSPKDLLTAFRICDADATAAARSVGISRETFYRRIRKFGLNAQLDAIRRDLRRRG